MLVTPCIPSRQRAIRHFVLTNKVQTKHTALQVGTLLGCSRWLLKFCLDQAVYNQVITMVITETTIGCQAYKPDMVDKHTCHVY